MTRLRSSRDASHSPRSAWTSEDSLGSSITSFNTDMVPEATSASPHAASTSERRGDTSVHPRTGGGLADGDLAQFLESLHDLYDEDVYADCVSGSMFMDCGRRVGGGEPTHQQQGSKDNKPYDADDDELLRHQSSVACREYVRAKQDLTALANHLLQSLPADEASEGSRSGQENYILSTLTSIKRHITPSVMRSMREFPTSFTADGEFL